MKIQNNEQVKTTTHYWGYRELTVEEMYMVGGGGDFSGDGFGAGQDGYAGGGPNSYGGNTSGSLTNGVRAVNCALGISPRSVCNPRGVTTGTATIGIRGDAAQYNGDGAGTGYSSGFDSCA